MLEMKVEQKILSVTKNPVGTFSNLLSDLSLVWLSSDWSIAWIRSLGSVTTKSPYKSLLKTLQYTKDEDTYLHEQTEMSKELENHIENVTKGFCDWATKLSQSTNNTQPLTSTELRKMFISGDDQLTPDMFIPISIQDLTVIPREIRHLQQYPSKGEKLEKLLKKYENKKATGKNQRIVWYLKPTLWFQNSQIMDEKDTLTNKKENSTTSMGLDPELKSMHISQAYRQFVKDNKLTLPKFLSSGHEDMTCKK
ncbi:uncharacterized protein LOC143228696 isoform X2 [Tachypleus tridentatus]|uniref:uncharacterized protein LOC143228696 isoform X2 n=1 Tax=Tachypleus tridentatus TaxID=6853 RepID=UPI003FD5A504